MTQRNIPPPLRNHCTFQFWSIALDCKPRLKPPQQKKFADLKFLSVSGGTDSSFDEHDFAVHTFGDGVRDSMRAISQNMLQTPRDRRSIPKLGTQIFFGHTAF
jgi:hypothetical protein